MIAREFGSGAAIAHAASAFGTAMVFSIQEHNPAAVPTKEAYEALHRQMRTRVTTLMREIVAEHKLGEGGVNFKIQIDGQRN